MAPLTQPDSKPVRSGEVEVVKQSAKVVHVLGKESLPNPIPVIQKEQIQEASSMEPTLLKSNESVQQPENKEIYLENNEISFEFSVGSSGKESSINTPVAEKREETNEQKQEPVVYNLNDHTLEEDPTEEQLRKSRERIMKLKSEIQTSPIWRRSLPTNVAILNLTLFHIPVNPVCQGLH